MIREMLDLFDKEKERNPNVVLDSHKLADGIYIRIDPRKSWEENKKDLEGNVYVHRYKDDDESYVDVELRDWFKYRDYSSNYMNNDMNKALDKPGRKIHSISPWALFIKEEVLAGEKGKALDVSWGEHVLNYKEILKSKNERFVGMYPISGKKEEKEKQLKERDEFFEKNYGELITYADSEERERLIDESMTYLSEVIGDVVEELESWREVYDLKGGYIKLFLDEEGIETEREDLYDNEFLLYTLPSIFINNTYNVVVDGELWGVPPNNLTFNQKKPYLQLKSHGTEVTERYTLEDALKRQDLYSFLKHRKQSEWVEKGSKKSPTKRVVYEINSGKIEDADQVPFKRIDELNESVVNYTGIGTKEGRKDYGYLTELWQVKKMISLVYLGGVLKGSWMHLDPKVSDTHTNMMNGYVKRYKGVFYDWFVKGYEKGARSVLDEMTLSLLVDELNRSEVNVFNIHDMFNYRLFLLDYLNLGGKKGMGDRLVELQGRLKKDMRSGELEITSNEEYYFLAGQVIAYLKAQNESAKKDLGEFGEVFRVNKADHLKRKIEQLTMTYGHKVHAGNRTFRDTAAKLMVFDTDKKIKQEEKDYLIAGMLFDNVFFHKKEENKEETTVEEKGESINE